MSTSASIGVANNRDKINQLHQAVKDNNYDLVQELIKVIDINSLDEDKCPPLYYAIKSKRWKLVQFLITNGAKLNDDDEDKDECDRYARERIHNSIHSAVADLNVEESFIDFLLSQPTINIEQPETSYPHRTPILRAAEAGNIRILKHLITKYKPDFHVQCNNGCNLFHYAFRSKDKCTIELIQYIHSLGVDINISDYDRYLPLTYAINNNLPFEIIQQLIEYGAKFRVNPDDTSQLPNLINIIKRDENDYQLFKLIFPMIGKMLSTEPYQIKKLLFEAVCNGNVTIGKCIVDNSRSELNVKTAIRQHQYYLSTDQEDKENDLFVALGLNELHMAECMELIKSEKFLNILQLFEYLMENGITKGFFNFKTKYECYCNYTLLLFLAERPTTTLRLLQLCVEHGADIHAVDSNDYNILHSLCHVKEGTTSEDLITKIDYFIRLGVNVNAIGNSQLSTPLHFATENRVHSSQLVPHLINKHHVDIGLRSKTYSQRLPFVSVSTFEAVKAFVSKSNVNFKYDDGNTHLLILLGLADEFDFLKYGHDFESKRPIIPPIDDDYYKSALYLVDECGANVNVMNGEGDTPLHIILSKLYFKRQPIEIIKHIIELQDPHYLNHRNYRVFNSTTPLELVINQYDRPHIGIHQRSKAFQTFQLLLEHNANPILFQLDSNDQPRQHTILHYTLNNHFYLDNEDSNADCLESIINCCIDSNHIIPQ